MTEEGRLRACLETPLCAPDDGTTRAEVFVERGRITFCLWRCESMNSELERDLENLGVSLDRVWQGACQHE